MRIACEEFGRDQAYWLDDYALFRALKAEHDGAYYLEWPDELVRREPGALARARKALADRIDAIRFVQFLFDEGRGPSLLSQRRGRAMRPRSNGGSPDSCEACEAQRCQPETAAT